MRDFLLTLFVYFRAITTDVSCYEKKSYQVERERMFSGLGVSSPLLDPASFGNEQASGMRRDSWSFNGQSGPSYSAPSHSDNISFNDPRPHPVSPNDEAKQKISKAAQATGAMQLRPEAEAYQPKERGKVNSDGNSAEEWHGVFHKHYIPQSITQVPEVEVVQSSRTRSQRTRELDFSLFARVSEGFSRPNELNHWYETVVLQLEGSMRPEERHGRRIRFVSDIIGYKTAYQPFHAMPAIEGDEVLARGFLAAFEFGRQVLNACFQNNTKRIAYLFDWITQRCMMLKTVSRNELNKLFFWSIILAAAKEWYYREAERFAKYLWALDLESSSKLALVETVEKTRSNQGDRWKLEDDNRLRFENLGMVREKEQAVLAKILGYGEDKAEIRKWRCYIERICAKGYYYLTNERLEATIYEIFKKEIDEATVSGVYIPESKSLIYCNKWGLSPLILKYLVETVRETCASRSKFTMGYELSKDALDHFSRKVLDLVNYLTEKNEWKNYAGQSMASGRLLLRIYSLCKPKTNH